MTSAQFRVESIAIPSICSRLRLTPENNLGILAVLRASRILVTILQKTVAPEAAWQWMPMRLPIADRRTMARALGMAAERRNPLYLEWDSTTGRVRSLVWLKRTRERVLAAKRAGLPPEELLGYPTTDLIWELAADWGIGRFVLYRLLVEASPSISQRTVLQLHRKLQPDEYRAVLSALSPQIMRTWNLYVATINRELARLAGGPGRRRKHEFDFDQLPVEEQRLRKRFDRARVAAGLPVPRSMLAVHRVYDPVLPWRQASLLPSSAERLQILRFGWRREHSLIRFEEGALRRSLRGGKLRSGPS